MNWLLRSSSLRALTAILVLILLNGCSALSAFGPSVELQTMDPGEYISLKRGDILTRKRLSDATEQSIRVAGLDEGVCATPAEQACIKGVTDFSTLPVDRRLSAVAELWVLRANSLVDTQERIAGWLEAVRYSYAYLFFSDRRPGDRAFEDRQTQVRDWYNNAVQQVAIEMFDASRKADTQQVIHAAYLAPDGWTLSVDSSQAQLPAGAVAPTELLPASSLYFRGLRSLYRRDGLGAELVAPMDESPRTTAPTRKGQPATKGGDAPPWSEMPAPSITVLLQPDGDSLEEVLATKRMRMSVHDPYRESEIEWRGQRIPLAANFTAGYGLWLARSNFSQQSMRSLFGREGGIQRPHVYLMQPYDPDRRIIVMLHGLASSPEAWVNLANEILGDEELRQHYQVWQVYYPTNVPIALNHAMIRKTLEETLSHFDPARQANASSGLVLVGHSMGGVIARLMISYGDKLAAWAQQQDDLSPRQLAFADKLFHFKPLPNVNRAIFIAAPHRGTVVAGQRLARWVSGFIRLPITLLEGAVKGTLLNATAADLGLERIPNSVNNLDQNDSFTRAAADLPMSSEIRLHSIIAQADPRVALVDSDDGLVPYVSAHLPGAASEKIIVSGHSVQQSPAAILEIQRILRLEIQQSGR